MAHRQLAVSLPYLSQGETLARRRWQLQQLQGSVQSHGVFQCLERAAFTSLAETMYKAPDQRWQAKFQG